MSELAVKGCEVKITSGQSASKIQITTPPSSDMFVGSNGIYFGDIDVQLTSITSGSLTCASGTITIKGTNDDVLNSDGEKAVQKNDNGTKTLTFTDSSTGSTSDLPVTVQITDTGQTDVLT
jgi:putative lipoic acid-binding regulatory protein